MREHIESERWRLHMTKKDMCRHLGVTLKTYNGYIRGNTIPSDVLIKLHDLTKKSIEYLLDLEQDGESE